MKFKLVNPPCSLMANSRAAVAECGSERDERGAPRPRVCRDPASRRSRASPLHAGGVPGIGSSFRGWPGARARAAGLRLDHGSAAGGGIGPRLGAGRRHGSPHAAARHARRSERLSRSCTRTTASRRRVGLTSFPELPRAALRGREDEGVPALLLEGRVEELLRR